MFKTIRARLALQVCSTACLALFAHQAAAICISLVKGPAALDVETCGTVQPDNFDLTKPKYKALAEMDPGGRENVKKQYRGLFVKAKVVRSQAVQDGLATQKGALQGETKGFFIAPGQQECSAILGKRVAATIQEVCCDGQLDAPCLLDTGLTLTSLKVLADTKAASNSSSGTQTNAHGKNYTEAVKFSGQKNYRKAVEFWSKADGEDDIDIKGLYLWGHALREQDNCSGAIKPLKRIYELSQQNKVWADQEQDARRGLFLLARCYAKMGDASNAVFYLNGFLLDVKKYRPEITQSLRHKDFGWIHTSKEYIEYRVEAQRRLTKGS